VQHGLSYYGSQGHEYIHLKSNYYGLGGVQRIYDKFRIMTVTGTPTHIHQYLSITAKLWVQAIVKTKCEKRGATKIEVHGLQNTMVDYQI